MSERESKEKRKNMRERGGVREWNFRKDRNVQMRRQNKRYE